MKNIDATTVDDFPTPEKNKGNIEADKQLLLSAEEGDLYRLADALTNGADVNVADEDGMTALMLAAERGKEATADALINSGADVNLIARFGITALTRASYFGKTNYLKKTYSSRSQCKRNKKYRRHSATSSL